MIKLIATDVDGTLVKDGTMTINPEYMTVIRKLTEMGIEFEDRQICFTTGRQITVYENGRKAWDAACSPFHYGGKRGLLEVMGVIVDGKRENGEVKGWQTADNVIQMVRDYKCNNSR